jgi:alpha-beta hydrolase superfamily lysophospholipase
MLVDLISVVNEEGLRLDGAFYAPAGSGGNGGPVDAMLIIHGSRGNFCDPATASMAADLSARGYACLALNTNAHDTMWYNPAGQDFKGNAFEVLENTMADLRAGVDHLWERGYRRIGLLGHSMGAVRVSYYAATQEDPRVAAIVPVSPVRLSYSYYLESNDAAEFRANVETAQRLIDQDEPDGVFRVGFPIPQYFSAASYLDKHGPAEKYNLVRLADRIRVQILTLNGSRETHTRLRNMAQDLAAAAVNSPRAATLMIEEGEHSLVNRTSEASAAVLEWLAALTPQETAA